MAIKTEKMKKWEYKTEIAPIGCINYEAEKRDNGWVWVGNCMTSKGMLYTWKR